MQLKPCHELWTCCKCLKKCIQKASIPKIYYARYLSSSLSTIIKLDIEKQKVGKIFIIQEKIDNFRNSIRNYLSFDFLLSGQKTNDPTPIKAAPAITPNVKSI